MVLVFVPESVVTETAGVFVKELGLMKSGRIDGGLCGSIGR